MIVVDLGWPWYTTAIPYLDLMYWRGVWTWVPNTFLCPALCGCSWLFPACQVRIVRFNQRCFVLLCPPPPPPCPSFSPPSSLLASFVCFFGKMEGGVDPIAQYISTSRVLSLLMFSLYHIRIHTWHSTRWPLKLYEINKQLQQPLYNGYWAMR